MKFVRMCTAQGETARILAVVGSRVPESRRRSGKLGLRSGIGLGSGMGFGVGICVYR